jgi:hypothetical protein
MKKTKNLNSNISFKDALKSDLVFGTLKDKSLPTLMSENSTIGWSEFNAKANTTISMENIKMPIIGNAYFLYAPDMERCVDCISSFLTVLHQMDDIRVFATHVNSYFIVSKLPEKTVLTIFDLLTEKFNYEPI